MKTYDKYKPSGIDWIGDIPEHWEIKRLKFWINSTFGGGTPSTSNRRYWNGNIPWVSPKDMKIDFITKTEDYITELALTESATSLIPPERVLIVVRSGILKHTLPVAINKVEVSLNQDMKAFEPNSKLLSCFLFWKLKGQSSDILTTCNKIGATVDSIEMEDLFNFPFAVPPLNEQTAIADYLDEKTAQIDLLIRNKLRLIELLKAERTAIINQAVTRGINPTAKLKPSGIDWLGDIPEHWEVKRLKRVSEKITNGFVGATVGILQSDGVRYIQSLHIKENTLKFNYPYYVSEEWSRNHSRSILKEKDILVVQTGAGTGNIAIVPKEFEGCNCHALIIIRINKQLSDADFIMNALTSDYGKHLTKSIETGALHPHLNSTKICDIELLIPPIEEQKQIVAFIETATTKIDATIAKIEREIELVQEYRTALIAEIVTGKIKVV